MKFLILKIEAYVFSSTWTSMLTALLHHRPPSPFDELLLIDFIDVFAFPLLLMNLSGTFVYVMTTKSGHSSSVPARILND